MIITITRNHQPYTIETWHIESHSPVIATDDDPDWLKSRAAKGWVNVRGFITDSETTDRLWHATSTRKIERQPLDSQMPSKYLVAGARYVTVAM